MTPQQINEAIAEHLMKWCRETVGSLPWRRPDGGHSTLPDWHGGADLEGLMVAAVDKGISSEIWGTRSRSPRCFVFAFSDERLESIHKCNADSPSAALCESILRALGKWEGGAE